MVKDWADQCSSDEEDYDDTPTTNPDQVAGTSDEGASMPNYSTGENGENNTEMVSDPLEPAPPTPSERDYPIEPPFTAYVGNLSFTIRTGDALVAALTDIVRNTLQVEMNITNGRVIVDRNNNNRSKGFGYVEVDTLESLQKLMELNTLPEAQIDGRRLKLDISSSSSGNNRRNSGRSTQGSGRGGGGRGRGSDIDGSKFRQGRYVKNDIGGGPTAEQPDEPPKQRPSLVLKPRSKPTGDGGTLENSTSSLSGSNSNIFGNAVPRDEMTWQERRKSGQAVVEKAQTPQTDTSSSGQPRRDSRGGGGSGRGGRSSNSQSGRAGGRGRGGRGEYSGRGGQRVENNHRTEGGADHAKGKADDISNTKPEKATAPPPAVAVAPMKPVEPEKKPPAKASNAFASLAIDSDSD